jgi:outer membrane protein assembly factor BamA
VRVLFILILCHFIHSVTAQVIRQDTARMPSSSVFLLTVTAPDKPHVQRVLPTKQRQLINDSTLKVIDAAILRTNLQQSDYLAASFDHYKKVDSVITARLWLGPAFRWVQFRPADALSERWLRSTNIAHQFKPGKPIRPELLLRAQKYMLEEAENNGYPFAAIWLDSMLIDSSGGVSGVLRVRPGLYFEYNDLKINGTVKLPKSMLARYLGIRKGDPFSRAQVLDIRGQLKSLPYLDQYANPTVNFSGSTATVNLWLKKKRAGRFDFIIGLLPQTATTPGNASNLILTGSLNGTFLNALGQGERLSIEMERLRPETQKMDIQTAIPYIAGSPFGFEGRLNIFKRDSTWVDAQGNIGVLYLLSRANKISFLLENRSSYLQSVDSVRVVNNRQLPANLDFRQNGLGVEVEFTSLDYRFNPRKGYVIQSKLIASRHTIQKNNEIIQYRDPNDENFDFSTLYDSIKLKTVRIRPEIKMEGYIPFAQRFTCLLRARAAGIFTKDPVSQNEQYRLGGNKLLRGFDEESLFATRWAVFTTEIRLIIGQNAFMSVFADGGYIENITARTRIVQRPLGFGAGMNFETAAGVFGISAAVGRTNAGEGLDLRATKIHVGYVSVF